MQIFLDMDECITWFVRPALEKMNAAMDEPEHELSWYAAAAKEDIDSRFGGDEFVRGHIDKYDFRLSKPVVELMRRLLGNDLEFWADMPWYPGGLELWNLIKEHKPTILSYPIKQHNSFCSEVGKDMWIRENLGREFAESAIFTDDKSQFAIDEDGSPNILIDDYRGNIDKFKRAGGLTIYYRDMSPEDCLKQLKELLSEYGTD